MKNFTGILLVLIPEFQMSLLALPWISIKVTEQLVVYFDVDLSSIRIDTEQLDTTRSDTQSARLDTA